MITKELNLKNGNLSAFIHDNEIMHAWIHEVEYIKTTNWKLSDDGKYKIKHVTIKTKTGFHQITLFTNIKED